MQRLRRWAKKLGLVVLELFVVLTLASVAYNLATADRVKPASELYGGPFVTVDGKHEQTVHVTTQKLYHLLSRPKPAAHDLQLKFAPGVSAFAFTFG